MRKYRKKTALTARNMYLKKNIKRTQRRAKIVGLLYLLGTFAIAALACLPLMTSDLAPIGITAFTSTLFAFNLEGAENIVKFANCALYALLLLVVFINAIKVLCKLGWLFASKGTKDYGFNRNVYAMEDMGRVFSGSFAWLLMTYVLIGLLCGGFVSLINTMMLIALGVGFGIHFICGFFGAKVRYYDLENGHIVEQKRLVGRFACLLRNFFQIAVIAGILYFLDFKALNVEINALLGNGTAQMIMFVFLLEMAAVLCLFVLIKHATAITEYSMEGIYGSGMKNFRVFSFFIFLLMVAGAVLCAIQNMATDAYLSIVLVGVVAFVGFVIEIVMRKYPRLPETIEDGKFEAHGGEFTFDMFSRIQQEMAQNNTRPNNGIVII